MNPGPSVEDILIGPNRPMQKKKKSKAPIFLVFVLILAIAAGGAAAYYYYENYMTNHSKADFFSYLKTTNLSSLFNFEDSLEIINKTNEQSNHKNLNVKLNTNADLGEENKLDINKFEFSLDNISDKENKKDYFSMNLNYSNNSLFQIKALSNENQVAISSDEISDKFFASEKDNLEKVLFDITGININIKDKINIENKIEPIDLTHEEKEEMLSNYTKYIYNNLPEENFSTTENILVILDNKTTITTNSYSLKLKNSEINSIYIALLKQLRNDTNLLKAITTEKVEKTTSTNVTNTVTNTIIDNSIEVNTTDVSVNQYDTNSTDSNDVVQDIENVTPPDLTMMRSSVVFDELPENSGDYVTEEVQTYNENNSNSTIQNNTNLISENDDASDLKEDFEDIDMKILASLLFNYKINYTLEEVQNLLDIEITELENKSIEEKEWTISLYVAENRIQKMSIKSSEQTIEIEFSENGNKQGIKFTVLGAEEMPKLEDATNVFSKYASENTEKESNSTSELEVNSQENEVNETSNKLNNGFCIRFEKTSSETSSKIYLEYDFISNLEINEKITCDINSKGTSDSKEIKNEVVMSYTTNDSQSTVNINFNIGFEGIAEEIPSLTDENTIFFDRLNEEELKSVIEQIENRISEVVLQKQRDLNLIDTNNSSTVLEPATPTVTFDAEAKEAAKNALINEVSNRMGIALNNGEQYTLANLEGLTIEGYNVTVKISGDIAIVTVNGYVFNIDSGFNLSEG